jgi:superfamily I DNA/RNA helicase
LYLTRLRNAVFARSRFLLEPVEKYLKELKIVAIRLDNQSDNGSNSVRLGTMHQAKGLEFKAVFAIALSDEQLPSQKALHHLSDEAAQQDALARERHLLYVTITRARDFAYLCWYGQPTRFLESVVYSQSLSH